MKPNFHNNDFDFSVTSSSDELARKLRGSYGLVANFWLSPRGSHGEVGRAGPSPHVKIIVLRWSGDKSCRVIVMKIGERHDTTRPTFSSTNHIGLLSQRHQWRRYLYVNILHPFVVPSVGGATRLAKLRWKLSICEQCKQSVLVPNAS